MIPDTIPEPVPKVIVVAMVLQAPPVTASVSVIVAPAHTATGPLMAVGVGFTVTVLVAEHPAAV